MYCHKIPLWHAEEGTVITVVCTAAHKRYPLVFAGQNIFVSSMQVSYNNARHDAAMDCPCCLQIATLHLLLQLPSALCIMK